MPTIQVDFETYKAIVARRRSEAMSEGDVVREAFAALAGNATAASSAVIPTDPEPKIWRHKGVELPVGLPLEHTFRDGRVACAKVLFGQIEYDGKQFRSLSAAGVEAAGHQVDGWAFWNFRDERGNLLPMKAKRRN